MRLSMISTLSRFSSRFSLSHHQFYPRYGGYFFHAIACNRTALAKDGGRRSKWLMNMWKLRCFMSTDTNPVKHSYNESDKKHEGIERIKVEVFSKEHIKPSSPTPDNLRYYRLSNFDQTQAPVYYPFMFFYQNCNDNKNVEEIILEHSNKLKQSLSELLTEFYPFAGKVASELHIDCNDDGVYFVETRVNDRLSNVLKKPDNKFLQQLIPVVDSVINQPLLGSYISMVQVNFFTCGGVAITVQHNHKLVDGTSYMTFLKAWSAVARQDKNKIHPSYVMSSIFPQNTRFPYAPYVPIWCLTCTPALLKHGRSSTKRFVFDALSLRELKVKASKHQPVSRITSILALIWKCITIATQYKPSALHVPMNIRSRCSPPLPENTIGNAVLGTYARFDPDTSEPEIAGLAGQLSNAILNYNTEVIEEFKGENGHVKLVEGIRSSMETFSDYRNEYYLTTSMCNTGTNEVDFGWGKPIWSCNGNVNENIPLFMNRMILIDSCSDSGIEVWVTLEKKVMDAVMCNPELLSFAKVDPSPI